MWQNCAPSHSQEKLINGEHEQARHYLRGSVTMIVGVKAVVRTIDFTNVSKRILASQVIPFP